MSDLVLNSLIRKLHEGTLASLYLLSYDGDGEEIGPIEWVNQFQKKLTPLEDHPDILRLQKSPKEAEYKVESPAIKEFLTFISTRPLKLQKKFIFLFDAQDLSVAVSNKLLKVFEELSSQYCLIMLAPHNAPLLETVLSRAIKLKLQMPRNLDQQNDQIQADLQEVSTPQDLLQFFKNHEDHPHVEKLFIDFMLKQRLAKAPSTEGPYQDLDLLLKQLKDYEVSSAFNHSKISRLTPFFP